MKDPLWHLTTYKAASVLISLALSLPLVLMEITKAVGLRWTLVLNTQHSVQSAWLRDVLTNTLLGILRLYTKV